MADNSLQKNIRPWHGSAFIVEALALLFFLSISIAVLMLLFSSSYERSIQADRFSHATILATNEAELFATQPQETSQTKYFKETEAGTLDKTTREDGSAQSLYKVENTITVDKKAAGALYHATIVVSYDNDIVYELETSRYASEGGVV